MIYEIYGEKRTDTPNKEIVDSMKGRILQEEYLECYTGKEKEDRYRRLWEIYFYLFYGLYTSAWNKINQLSEQARWKVPGDVYHFLKELHT